MRFIDEAKIVLKAGNGGKGCVSFRREKFVPRGGPDGGDGGKGGNIVLKSSSDLSTLQDFRMKRIYEAKPGQRGGGAHCTGRGGEDIELRLPVGTIIRDAKTQEVLFDFDQNQVEWTACRGGRGGKGNAHFASSTLQTPKFSQDGQPGEEKEVVLELKLLADVGIIGFPNAGKSTLISVMSAARPKVADYAFTTLTPNLGVVDLGDYRSIVVADIPGLVQGAHRGAGLGHRFLKHIERTRLLIHLIDGAALLEKLTEPLSNSEEEALELAIQTYRSIRNELALYSEALLHKPEIVAINKIDILPDEFLIKVRKKLREELFSIRGSEPRSEEPLLISAATQKNIPLLRDTLSLEMSPVS